MEADDPPAKKNPASPIQEQLACIVARLDNFPLERFAKMEVELQQLKCMVQDEAKSYRQLAEQIHRQSVGLHEAIEKQLDRAFRTCQRDRDLRLGHLSDRIETVQEQTRDERNVRRKLRLAVLGAGCALIVSLFSAVMNWLLRK